MRTSQKVYDDVKRCLIDIKRHGGYIGQYDSLFKLFIESFKDGHMEFNSSPRLTGQAIIDALVVDLEYCSAKKKVRYNLEEAFNDKWTYWTEAFKKGFSERYITWMSNTDT